MDGFTVIAPCLSLEIFLYVTDDANVLDFYDRSRDSLAGHLTHYQTGAMRRFARLDARADAKVRTQISQPSRGTIYSYAMVTGGDPADGVPTTQVELHVYRRPVQTWMAESHEPELAERRRAFENGRYVRPLLATKLRVTVPLDHPLADAQRFRDWALGFRLIQTSSPFSAHGGPALNFARYGIRASLIGLAPPLLADACRRHPGLDWDVGGLIPTMVSFRPDPPQFVPLVKRASWLNLVCDQTLSRIGGGSAVGARLRGSEDIEIQDLPHGLAISSGPALEVGDLRQGNLLQARRRVAQVLRPVRVDRIDGVGAGFSAAETNQWLNAFDSDAPADG